VQGCKVAKSSAARMVGAVLRAQSQVTWSAQSCGVNFNLSGQALKCFLDILLKFFKMGAQIFSPDSFEYMYRKET
jgi:hypothetical protein